MQVTTLLRNVLVVAAFGMLQRVAKLILGMTEVATTRSFLELDKARLETLAARAIAL